MSEFRPRRFDILPLVIKILMIINGLVFLLQFVMGEIQNPSDNHVLTDLFAFHYWRSPLFKPHQLLTHLFMHASFWHLALNMITLWIFGTALEHLWGHKRFLRFYLICGLGAALCYMGVITYENIRLTHEVNTYLANPSYDNFRIISTHYDLVNAYNEELSFPDTPAKMEVAKMFLRGFQIANRDMAFLGASGAVFGLLFAFGYLFPNSYIYIYVPIKSKYIVGFLILAELVVGIQNVPGDNVAHFAHLGGVLISYLLLRDWHRKGRHHFY